MLSKEECNHLIIDALYKKDYISFSSTITIYESENKDSIIKKIKSHLIERGKNLGRPEIYFEIVNKKTRRELFNLMLNNIQIFLPLFNG